jgi:hypothetical protein
LREELTAELVALQENTLEEPYSILHRLKLAKVYKKLGYPDLAAGDAYKALILVDEIVDEGEYYDEALRAAWTDFVSEKLVDLAINTEKEGDSTPDDEVMSWVRIRWSNSAYVSRCIASNSG